MTKKDKLTPQEAFEHLKAVFPWLKRIDSANGVGLSLSDGLVSNYCRDCNIDWGGWSHYKPETYRPATIADIKTSLKVPMKCLVNENEAMMIGGFVDENGAVFPRAIRKIDGYIAHWDIKCFKVVE